MSLDTDILAAISLAGIGMTIVYVIAVNFLVGRQDRHRYKAKEKEKEKT